MLLDSLIQDGLRLGANAAPLRIHKIVSGASFSTMKGDKRVFQNLYPLTVYLENAYGFAYGEAPVAPEHIQSVVNKDLRSILRNRSDVPLTLRVALCDALYASARKGIPKNFFEGPLHEKARRRAEIILEGIPNHASVLLLGPVSEIIEEAKRRRMKMYVTDRSAQKIGKEFFDAIVHPAASVRTIIEANPDISHVVATGMIFVSETADEVFETSRDKDLHLTLFMETGARFAPALLKYGADRIVAEEFPFYDFQGRTGYAIYETDLVKSETNRRVRNKKISHKNRTVRRR